MNRVCYHACEAYPATQTKLLGEMLWSYSGQKSKYLNPQDISCDNIESQITYQSFRYDLLEVGRPFQILLDCSLLLSESIGVARGITLRPMCSLLHYAEKGYEQKKPATADRD